MNIICKHITYGIALLLGAMFFSCTNNAKEVRDLLKDQNKPVGEAKNITHVYKDSGRVVNKMNTTLLYDFSNREEHPYSEFPKGIKIVTIDKNGKDSTTITGNYAITFGKTKVSEIRGNVVIFNHTQRTKLETNQLFWDQREKYVFTEEGFRLTTPRDTIEGFGFESKQNLKKWIAKDITGDIRINQKEL